MSSVPTFEQKKVVSLFVVLAWIGLCGAGLWLCYALRALIPPLLVAIIIALTLAPEVDRMERRGLFGLRVRRGAAIAFIYLLFLAFFGLLVSLLPQVSGQLTGLITSRLPNAVLHGSAQDMGNFATHLMNRLGVPTMMRGPVLQQAGHVPLLLGKGLQWLGDNLPALAGNLIWVVIVPVITFFILLDFNKILGKGLLLVASERREGALTVLTDIIAVFGNWVRGVLSVMGLDMVVIGAVLWLTGTVLLHGQHAGEPNLRSYALTLAVTAGILYTIPYFGAFVSTILIGFVTYATQGTVPALVVTGIMIVIHQVVFDNIIAPRVIGGSVHLHPLLTLIALIAGGTLFGIAGTLVSVPLAAAIQVVVLRLFPQFQADVVAVRQAANVVQTTLSRDSEADKPPSRKDDDAPFLEGDVAVARQAAAVPTDDAPAVLPPLAAPGDVG